MSKTKSILIVGVGGQGTLLASKVLGFALMDQGFDVKVSEVHGMSQRGGSVTTHVRWGRGVASPVIELGEADYIIAFEQLEAARALPYLKAGGVLLTSEQGIDPMPVITGAVPYPEELLNKIHDTGVKIQSINAQALAESAGNAKAVNVVMLGLFARHAGFDREVWDRALERAVPPRLLELNRKAFAMSFGAQ